MKHGLQAHGLSARLQGSSAGSIAVLHGLSCHMACGIFLDQGLNLCLPDGQVDSLPLRTWEA